MGQVENGEALGEGQALGAMGGNPQGAEWETLNIAGEKTRKMS